MNSDRTPRHRRSSATGARPGPPGAAPVWALHLPLDPDRRCALVPVRGDTVALPAAGRPADIVRRWVDVVDGDRYAWYRVRPWRASSGRPDPSGPPGPFEPPPDDVNESAFVLTARLGYVDVADRIGLGADLLLVGLTAQGRPTDVPVTLLDLAHRCALTIELPQRTPGDHPLPFTTRPATVTQDVELLQRVLHGLRRHRGQVVPRSRPG